MATAFYKLDGKITENTGLSFRTQSKSFKNHFGVNPHTCLVIYEKSIPNFMLGLVVNIFVDSLFTLLLSKSQGYT